MSATLRTIRATPAVARKLHGYVDIGTRSFPVHLEKVKPGVWRMTDRARCTLCAADDRAAEVDKLRARLAELGVRP